MISIRPTHGYFPSISTETEEPNAVDCRYFRAGVTNAGSAIIPIR